MDINGNIGRRGFMETGAKALAAGGAVLASQERGGAAPAKRPNVILAITDDQGYGDLGAHGNPYIRTPNLDRFAAESVHVPNFCVSPVCAPTRACLMTGRYNYRTGVVDTYLGRAMMHSDEITIAELLSNAGYRTGIFGKWHLGDNYPMRPNDQGFQESLVHKGGGIGQPSDPPGGDSYFDSVLYRNGEAVKTEGYCTDVFADAAVEFIRRSNGQPFFAYLATNAPHTPLEIEDRYVKPYLDMGLDETTAKIYGMVENVDENMGKLLAALKANGLEEDTVVIFLTDNGPQQNRYNAGLRGRKGQVYDGGIRVPFYIRYGSKWTAGGQIGRMAAHIDILPTLAELCGAEAPQDRKIDGRSLVPLLNGNEDGWEDRTIYLQWHRGDEPEPHRNAAARGDRYKLVNGGELYDLKNDPRELNDIAASHPQIVEKMRADYEAWFEDVSSTRGYDPPRIFIGTPRENPVMLTRQDWRGPKAGWGADSLGYWELRAPEGGEFSIRLLINAAPENGVAHLRIGGVERSMDLEKGAVECVFPGAELPAGDLRLEAWVQSGDESKGVLYAEVKRT